MTLRAARPDARAAATLSVAVALVVALACGCTTSATPAPVADTTYGAAIEINTPQGLRAKQTIDMLNSDWPIGTVGVRTMATPQQVNPITSAMGNLWLDRPITVAGIDIGAGELLRCSSDRYQTIRRVGVVSTPTFEPDGNYSSGLTVERQRRVVRCDGRPT